MVAVFIGGVIARRIVAILLKQRHTPVILFAEAVILAIALVNFLSGPLSVAPLTIATGAQNAALPRTREGKISHLITRAFWR
jgi:hypothetical protein